MRGKNIFPLTLAALMLSVLLTGVGHAQFPNVYVDPPLVTGLVAGDTFDVNVCISGAEFIYAWEFTMSYPPLAQRISVVTVLQGNFIPVAAANVNPFNGTVSATGTLIGDVLGKSGSGILATVRFSIIEPAGEFPLSLHASPAHTVRLWIRDSLEQTELIELLPEDIIVADGYFVGPSADLWINPGENRSRIWEAGKPRRFKSIVRNTGYAPVWVRAKYTNVRDDGKVVSLYSGQHLYTTKPRKTEYYYVNSFTPVWTKWQAVGTSPYLDKDTPTSYINGTNYCQLMGLFGFEDITLNPGDIIYRVTLEGRTKASSTLIDYDVYNYPAFSWFGSLWGSTAWTWRTPRWTTDTVDMIDSSVKTQAGFNSFQVLVHYWTETGGSLGWAALDALRLKVEFIGIDPTYAGGELIQPGVERTLDWAIWDLWSWDAGTYTLTAKIEYRYGTPDRRFPQYWATGPTLRTSTWMAKP